MRTRAAAVAVTLVLSCPAIGRASEIWVPATAQQDTGGLETSSSIVWPVTPAGAVRLAWAIPGDLRTFQSAKLVMIPAAGGETGSVNVVVCTAASETLASASCAGPFAQAFSGAANELLDVEIGPFVAPHLGAAGASYVAVLAYTTPSAAAEHFLGLRFSYQPSTPANVATLGANTFSGTQTAPAFVGDGSGLTNLPPGPQGPAGPEGAAGPQGPAGPAGTAGQSAQTYNARMDVALPADTFTTVYTGQTTSQSAASWLVSYNMAVQIKGQAGYCDVMSQVLLDGVASFDQAMSQIVPTSATVGGTGGVVGTVAFPNVPAGAHTVSVQLRASAACASPHVTTTFWAEGTWGSTVTVAILSQ